VGTYPLTLKATNGIGSTTQSFTLTVGKASQAITFAALANRNFSAAPVSLGATTSSGLAIAFSTPTSAVCTVSGTSFTMVAAGTCTLNANQAGDDNYAAAPQVQRSFTITAVAPDAPVLSSALPGNTQASFAFTAPASNGGA